ncbi:hypothetical protein KBA63_00145 [Candidatus Woesebacteria bacterium]|nr:hypothetical protein [Candidatus Woesebacteria bacterium]
MKKIKQVWYSEPTPESREKNPYDTGLVLELEDGTILAGMTTDVLQSFRIVPKSINQTP